MINLRISSKKTGFFHKDQAKADLATKFIGRGSIASSTHAYSIAAGALANTGHYNRDDIVMISAEGARRGRIDPDYAEIQRAMDAGAILLTDSPLHRERRYNVGERQVTDYLLRHGYVERFPGRWHPKEQP